MGVSRLSDGLLINMTRDLLPNEKLNTIQLSGANTPKVSFNVPKDAKSGDTIHIILEVQDNAKHHMKRYQRVIVTVR